MRIRTSRYKPFMKGAPPLDYRLYLFDFDYTLVNSEPAIVKCFHITLQKLGYPDVPDERIKKTIGLPMVEAVKRIIGTADTAEAEHFVDAYSPEADRYMTPGTTFFSGAVETLRAIKATGAKVGIISNKTHRRIQEKFNVDHVPELIDLIIGSNDVKSHKPEPTGAPSTTSTWPKTTSSTPATATSTPRPPAMPESTSSPSPPALPALRPSPATPTSPSCPPLPPSKTNLQKATNNGKIIKSAMTRA